MKEQIFLRAATDIEATNTLETVWTRFLDALRQVGIEFAVYITVNPDFEEPLVLTNASGIYSGAPPAQDPFLHWCCTSYQTTNTGAEYLEDYDYLPDEAKAFIRNAETLGFRSGLGLPVRLQGSSRFGGFNLGTRMARGEFEAKIIPLTDQLQFLCLLAHRRIEELSQKTKVTPDDGFRGMLIAPRSGTMKDLSPREHEVIYLIAQGMSRKEAAKLCQISPNTVAEYTKAAYRKLGVRNRAEAADALRIL